MNSHKQILAVAVGLALSGMVAAQSPGSPAGGGTRPGTAAPGGTSPAGTPAATSPAAAATHPLKAVRLSKLDGVNIYDSSAKKIGEIDDVVIDPASGRVLHALVSMGGVLGVGAKEFEVPLKELRVFSKSADDSVPAKAELAAAPDSLTPAKKMEKDSPNVMGSKLIGTDVNDSNGKDAGEIEDVVVDLESGQVQYALMEFDKDWSVNDKLFAFKMSDFQKGKDGKELVLNVTKESLNQLPSLEKSRIDKTDLSDASWLQKVGAATAGASPGGASTTTGSTAAGSGSGGSTPAAGAPSGGSAPATGAPSGGSTPATGTTGSAPGAPPPSTTK